MPFYSCFVQPYVSTLVIGQFVQKGLYLPKAGFCSEDICFCLTFDFPSKPSKINENLKLKTGMPGDIVCKNFIATIGQKSNYQI